MTLASDPDGDPLTFAIQTGPNHGTATLVTTTLTFTPTADYAGNDSLIFAVSDGKGGTAQATITLTVSMAPPLDTSVATDIAASTEFLYTGNDPIQTGVVAGTIEARRVGVLRGKVLSRDGSPLTGVIVTILDHPEFGQTVSRADGMFDMAVNGGGMLTVNYAKADYLPVQRQVDAPWRDYIWLPDVVIIPLDPHVTTIDLTANIPFQVARGSVISDSDGTRQETLLFPQGTAATMTLPNGTTQTLTTLHVRSTEYTVGENGPEAMPADLPPQSGYTYATEFSADEAITAGAKTVHFNQPVITYNENFLGFPVGTIVPVGYYDKAKAAWIPSDNGRVVKILSISGGLAELDTDGDGTADNGTALSVTLAERVQIALLYQSGQSLWRVPTTHFSFTDSNWPVMPDCDPTVQSCAPAQPKPEGDDPLSDSCKRSGSIIECENQILGETIPIVGTSFDLHYQSELTPGRKPAYTLRIPLSGAKVPSTLTRIDLVVEVAGKRFTQSFPPASNQHTTFTWDGRDAYGRLIQGRRPVSVRIGYVYAAVYMQAGTGSSSFASFSSSGVPVGDKGRQQFTFWQDWQGSIGAWDARALGLGGWSLNVQHAYDPTGKILYLGDGSRQSVDNIPDVITTVAGRGNLAGPSTSADGVPATEAHFERADMIAVGPDGSLYIPDRGSSRVRRVMPNGIITTVVGLQNGRGYSGDNGLATAALVNGPQGVAVGPDGSLYVADTGNNRIRRVGLDGIITTVAGNGTFNNGTSSSPPGDGGPAIQSQVTSPRWIAVGPDGSIYIADHSYYRIRKVDPNGVITTIAGTGQRCVSSTSCGDGGPASLATFYSLYGIALGPDGSLYIADADINRIRRIGPDGRISTVAGRITDTLARGFEGDGGPATDALFNNPTGVAVGHDGSLYIADESNLRVRRIGPDGIITTVAGTGTSNYYDFATDTYVIYGGDGRPAAQAQIPPTYALVGPDGSLYIWGNDMGRVRRVAPILPGFTPGDLVIAAEDGSEVYVFSNSGRHLRTLQALTGAVLYQFAYDTSGRLLSITDGDDNITAINRDASGNPISIVGPYGQTTTLTLDANGYLTSVTNPAQESVHLGYTADGLLTSLIDPRGNTHTFTYNNEGRLIRDANPAAGVTTLDRVDTTQGYTVTLNTALNHTTTYQIENLPNGDLRRVNTFPNGLKSESLKKPDETYTWSDPDGTTQSVTLGPDPRWGMQSPLSKIISLTTPDGLTYNMQVSRTAVLADPNNPFSLVKLTELDMINGKTHTSTYTAATRTWVARSPTGRIMTTTLDTLGRVVFEQVAGLAPANYAYAPRGRLVTATLGTGTDARTITFTYNNDGYLASVTDPLNRTATFEYDLAGRVINQTLPDSRVISYAYDASGNLTALTPPGQPAHNFSYTPINLPLKYTPPDVNPGIDDTQYTYNADRQLTLSTRPDSQTMSLGYDSAGRLNALTIARGMFGYTYDSMTGNVATITAPGGINLAYTYDGELVTGKTWSGPVAGTVGYTYDNSFRLTSTSVNGSNTTAFQYDDDSLLTAAGTLTLSHSAQTGLLTGGTLGSIADTWSYNGFAEATSYNTTYNATPLYNVQYERDKLGRISQKTEAIGGKTTTYGYTYDLSGRLTTVLTNGVTSASYVYDSNGNRLSYTSPAGVISGTYDAQDRLLQYGPTTYAYTANGELLTKTNGAQITSYQYDALGNLISVTLPNSTQISYLVDGQNRRIGKQVNGTLVQSLLYEDDLRPIAELDGSNNVVSRFVYATHINVPDYMVKAGVTYRIVTDQLGSPRLVVNTVNGQVIQRMDFDEFGRVLNDTNPGFQPFGFAGGLYDRDTKLVRFGARDYDAATGHWTAKDPIRFGGQDTNQYSYVFNDPINTIDYNGKVAFLIPIIICAGGGCEVAIFAAAAGTAAFLGYIAAQITNDRAESMCSNEEREREAEKERCRKVGEQAREFCTEWALPKGYWNFIRCVNLYKEDAECAPGMG